MGILHFLDSKLLIDGTLDRLIVRSRQPLVIFCLGIMMVDAHSDVTVMTLITLNAFRLVEVLID